MVVLKGGKDCGTVVVRWNLGESLRLSSVSTMTQGMGRTV